MIPLLALLLSGAAAAAETPAPLPVRPPSSSAPLPVRGVDAFEVGDVQSFERHHRLGRSGSRVVVVGLGAALVIPLVGAAGCSASPNDCFGAVLLVAAGEVGAAATVSTGMVLLFVGGVEAANDARHLGVDTNARLGWIGVGLIGGSIALTLATPVSPVFAVAGIATFVSGATLGFVQLAQDGHRQLAVTFVPTPNGFAIAGRF